MAARSSSARRRRWLVFAGLAGVVIWVVRSRRTSHSEPLDAWPTAPDPPAGSTLLGVQAASVSDDQSDPAAPVPAAEELPEPSEPGGAPTPAADGPPDPVQPASEAAEQPVSAAPAEPTAPATADDQPAAPSTGRRPTDPPTPPLGLAQPTADPDPGLAAGPEPTAGHRVTNPLFSPTTPRPSPTPRPRATATAVGSGAAPALADGSAPGPEYTIKGKAGSKLFHRPNSPYYSRTKAEVWFRTATDARAAGFTEWVPKRARDRSTDI